MEKIVIYGAGEKGVLLYNLFRKFMRNEYEILFFCDMYKKNGSYVNGMKVISPTVLKEMEAEVDKVIVSSIVYVDEIQTELKKHDLSMKIYVVPDYVFRFKWKDVAGGDMPFLVPIDLQKPRMPYLEIGIVNHCNLRCKGCSGLANIAEPGFMQTEELERSMQRLKELFWGIKYLKLYGGEPLLHPDLEGMMAIARKYFPDAVLVIHSNGLLVPKMEASILSLMVEKDIQFEFTQYPPTGVKKRQIVKKLETAGVAYHFREPLYEFRKAVNLAGDYDEREIYKACSKCVNLYDGKLSCGMDWMINNLEKKFNVEICEDKFQHCIDIYNTSLNGWEINALLDSPYNLCKYCAFMDMNEEDEKMMKWSCGEPFVLSDWVYEGKKSK